MHLERNRVPSVQARRFVKFIYLWHVHVTCIFRTAVTTTIDKNENFCMIFKKKNQEDLCNVVSDS